MIKMNKRFYNFQKQKIELRESEVHIWNFDLDKISSLMIQFEKILSDDELVRANKFHFEIDKVRFICSRGLLRLLLGIYTGISSRGINFTFNEYGKPSLIEAQNNFELHFNLSHSKNFMSVGFTKNALIGVDVELMKPLKDHLRIAKRFFSYSEIEQLNSFPSEKISEGFYTCWTAKEAVIKLSGKGLSYPLKEFDVEVKDLSISESYRYNVTLKTRPENLIIEVFRLNETLYGACAVDKDNLEFIHYYLDGEDVTDLLFLINKITRDDES